MSEEKIDLALNKARTPGGATCPKCGEELFSPMDKLSIALYGECPIHLDDDSQRENNLFKIAEHL